MMEYQDTFVEKRNFILGIVISALISTSLAFIEIWQFILLAGIMAGFINDKMRKGAISGALGVLITWSVYMLIAIFSRNAYVFFDQFAVEIFGSSGFGWALLLLSLMLGMIFGALGGAIGSALNFFLAQRRQKNPQEAQDSVQEKSKSSDSAKNEEKP